MHACVFAIFICCNASKYSSYIKCNRLYQLEVTSKLFNVHRSSRFGKLQGIKCALAGRNLYIRFTCSTGDAMGMNMVSKGVENVLRYLRSDFPDMDLISLSGLVLPFCYGKERLVFCNLSINIAYHFIRQLKKISV